MKKRQKRQRVRRRKETQKPRRTASQTSNPLIQRMVRHMDEDLLIRKIVMDSLVTATSRLRARGEIE